MGLRLFVEMFALETFGGNGDFPHNNIVCWKPWAEGSVWRWVLKDLDHFANKWDTNGYTWDYFEYIMDKASSTASDRFTARNTHLFALFLQMPQARDLFIDRLAIFMGDFLHPANIEAMRDGMRAELEPEYTDHCKRFFPDHYQWHMEKSWPEDMEFIVDWCKERRDYLNDRMRTFFGLSAPYALTIDGVKPASGSINGISLSMDRFDGFYYREVL